MSTLGGMLLFLTLSFMMVTVPPVIMPVVVTAHFMGAAAIQTGARAEGVAEGIAQAEAGLADTTAVDEVN